MRKIQNGKLLTHTKRNSIQKFHMEMKSNCGPQSSNWHDCACPPKVQYNRGTIKGSIS